MDRPFVEDIRVDNIAYVKIHVPWQSLATFSLAWLFLAVSCMMQISAIVTRPIHGRLLYYNSHSLRITITRARRRPPYLTS